MERQIGFEAIREVLFQLDPMHTGSVENDATDEYDLIAHSVCQHMEQGQSLERALIEVFDEAFWPGALNLESAAACSQAIKGASRCL